MKFSRAIILLAFPLYLFSCRPTKHVPNYLQNVSDSTIQSDVKIPELIIQKNDLLSIQIYSASTMPELSDALYNLPSNASAASAGGAAASGGGAGFLVDANGNIEYPRIGIIRASGLTKAQLADTIKRKVNEKEVVLTDPAVIIRFQNLKFTILGEVGTQGSVSVPTEHVTILQAIGLAGGITEYGQRESVKILREVDGKRKLGIVDLSSNKLFESPYYNLMQNDVVIVDPTRTRAKKVEQDQLIARIGLGLSLLTAMALVYNIFK